MTSIVLRVVGLVLGFLVGLRISAVKYKPPGLPFTWDQPRFEIDAFGLAVFSLIVMGVFKILNYFFNESNNAGIGEYLAAMLGGFIFGVVFFSLIPTIYHWVF
jgi:hypothetical protein